MCSPAFSWPHSSLITNQKQPGGPSPPLAGSLPLPLPCLPFLFSAALSRVFSSLIQRLASSNLPPWPPSPLSFIQSLALPRENSPLRYFCAILPSFNSRFLALSHPSFPSPFFPPFPLHLSSPSPHLREREMRYVFIVDIYISLPRAKTREL